MIMAAQIPKAAAVVVPRNVLLHNLSMANELHISHHLPVPKLGHGHGINCLVIAAALDILETMRRVKALKVAF